MDGTSLSQLVSGRAHRLTPKAGKINAGMQTLSASMIMLKSDNVIRFNNNPYRGSMLVFVENGKMNVVNEIDIEEYLYGVVPREVSESWTEEIIKTQAVLARTFALNGKYRARRGALFDLDDSTLSQVYTGYAAENGKVNRLVDITRSEVLMFGNKLAEVYYHSCCGGMTEDVGSVWGRNLTYLRSVPCDYCVVTSNFKWVYKIGRVLFAK